MTAAATSAPWRFALKLVRIAPAAVSPDDALATIYGGEQREVDALLENLDGKSRSIGDNAGLTAVGKRAEFARLGAPVLKRLQEVRTRAEQDRVKVRAHLEHQMVLPAPTQSEARMLSLLAGLRATDQVTRQQFMAAARTGEDLELREAILHSHPLTSGVSLEMRQLLTASELQRLGRTESISQGEQRLADLERFSRRLLDAADAVVGASDRPTLEAAGVVALRIVDQPVDKRLAFIAEHGHEAYEARIYEELVPA